MRKYNAEELYHRDSDTFICPNCEELLETELESQKESNAIARCRRCKIFMEIGLPEIRKKLIYVDQWFVSNLFDTEKEAKYNKIVDKLEELAYLQKIFVVSSVIHAEETAKIPKTEKQNRVWDKFARLSCGRFASDDVVPKQYADLIKIGKEQFSWQDILLKNPHHWTLPVTAPGGFKCFIHSSGQSLFNVTKRLQFDTDEQNKACRDILNKQCEEIDTNSTPEDCYSYIKNVGLEEILLVIEFYEKFKSGKLSLSGKYSNVLGYYRIIDACVNSCRKEFTQDSILEKLKQNVGNTIYDKFALSLEAQNLYHAIQTLKKGDTITLNAKKFSQKYGVSRHNDISHISAFVPYVDVFLTDNSARKQLFEPPVADHMNKIDCIIFSENNIEEFESYLEILLQKEELDCVRFTRKLLVGLSSEENDAEWEKIIMEKILKKIEEYKNNS